MPAKSARQYRLMAMVAHDSDAAKRVGVPQSVGREFVEETPSKMRSRAMSSRLRKSQGSY